MLRHDKHTAAATKIQTAWKGTHGFKLFAKIRHQIILIQAIHRSGAAKQYLNCRKDAATNISLAWRRNKAIESLKSARNAATKIASVWRRSHCMSVYKQKVQGMIYDASSLVLFYQSAKVFRLYPI